MHMSSIYAEDGDPNPQAAFENKLMDIADESAEASAEDGFFAKDREAQEGLIVPEADPEPEAEEAEAEAVEVQSEAEDTEEVQEELEASAEDESTDDATADEPSVLKIDLEANYEMPDGRILTGKEVENERLMHADYTRKTTDVSLEKEQVLEFKRSLDAQAQALEADARELQELKDLRNSSEEVREELSNLLAENGRTSAAEAIKKNPEVETLTAKLSELTQTIETMQRAETDAKMKASYEEKVDSLISAKYPHADKEVVRARILAGDFDEIEPAVKNSHDKIAAILADNAKTEIIKKVEKDSGKLTSPTRPVSTAVAEPVAKQDERLSGSIFDDENNAARSAFIRSIPGSKLNI